MLNVCRDGFGESREGAAEAMDAVIAAIVLLLAGALFVSVYA